jgi:hypothetical protein
VKELYTNMIAKPKTSKPSTLKKEDGYSLNVYILFEGTIKHYFRVNGLKVVIHEYFVNDETREKTKRKGEVIGEPYYHHTVYRKSEIQADANA